MKTREKPKLGVPQLWYDTGFNMLRLVEPTGRVEAKDLDRDTIHDWFASAFCCDTQELALSKIELYHEFICNIE